MFGRRFGSESSKVQVDGERLTTLLREWKDVEPQASFEAAVWRRIRAASMPEQRSRFAVAAWREWFAPRPAWVNAVAAAAGVIIGVGLAFSGPALRAGRHADDPLLQSETLAGSYLAMVAGEGR